VIADPGRIRTTLILVSELGHVGFMAPVDSEAVIRLPQAAGFDMGSGPSRARSSLASLETSSAEAPFRRRFSTRRANCLVGALGVVEVAIPHDVDDKIVRGWIRRGIGAHVAFRIESPSYFPELRRVMESEGFRMPAFMNGEALSNPAEGVTTVFFDRRPAQPLGIEFCVYD
jgi:hypothetical protein